MVFLKSVTMLAAGLVLAAAIAAQPPTLKDGKGKDGKAEVVKKDSVPLPAPSLTADPSATPTPADGDDKMLDDAILPYYNNYLREYRLGPGDQITVEVFGQCPDYCKAGITVPPNAKISYPLIREGIFVAGRTVEQIAAEITKRLDEYIIDPKVTVTLDKAMATRYSVMGNVATPGVRVMDRKVSVYEAVLDAGGVTKNGNKKEVAVVSYGKDGRLSRKVVNLADMEAGKADMVYLEPGDQVFVTGKGFTLDKVFDYLARASSVRYMMGSPL
jgi:polysaccharide export outer membrane protein